MREIIFRGKSLDGGEWIEGNLIRMASGDAGIMSPNIIDLIYVIARKVDPATVGEFTGLVDKNGKKVFEGDVLKISRKMDGMGTYYEPPLEYPVKVAVKWDMCAWMWETIEQDKYYIHFPDAWCHFGCEVIGNIHDNPELLKGDNNAEDD